GIEIRPRKRRRMLRDHLIERRRKPFVELLRAHAVDAALCQLALPPRADVANGRDDIGGWLLAAGCGITGRQRLALCDDRVSGGDAFGARGVVTLRIAREERIARGAEALPDRL